MHYPRIVATEWYTSSEVKYMKKNVGTIDSYIRYGIGIVFIVLAVFYSWWLLIPAAIAIATGALGTCGLYRLFGINTCKLPTPK